MSALIELSNVTRVYPRVYHCGRPQVALSKISLSIPAGQFAAVMGSSDSGKSTLLHLIAGLIIPRRKQRNLRRLARQCQ
jgi:ABC-type sugar transport system ATPase subunit